MPLTVAERKHLMPYGARKDVASELQVDGTYVSRVMNGEVIPKTELGRKKLRRVQVALARKLGRTADEVFPPEIAHTTEPAALAVAS
jgi:hypothetical protein